MYATLILAAVLAQPPQPTAPRTQPAQPRTQPAQPGAIPRAGAMTHSLDGDWQVVALEKDGRPVDGASTFTVSVRNNVATFSGGDEKNRPHAMRIEFGPNGQIRTTEQGTSDRPSAGTQPGGTAATERPAAGSPTMSGAKTGVYVMAGDYLAVSLNDRATGTTPRVQPGATPPGAIPGTTPRTAPPAGLPGTTPPAGLPGATPPATTPSTGFTASLPTEKPDICIVLKRSGSSRTPGSPGSPGSIPRR